jgi:hypothetical protein
MPKFEAEVEVSYSITVVVEAKSMQAAIHEAELEAIGKTGAPCAETVTIQKMEEIPE